MTGYNVRKVVLQCISSSDYIHWAVNQMSLGNDENTDYSPQDFSRYWHIAAS